MARLVPKGDGTFVVEWNLNHPVENFLQQMDPLRYEVGKPLGKTEAESLLKRVKERIAALITEKDRYYSEDSPHFVAATKVRYAMGPGSGFVIVTVGDKTFPASQIRYHDSRPDSDFSVLLHDDLEGGWTRVTFQVGDIQPAQP